METIKVSITKYQVKVTKDKDNLLVTNNNINAYTKLYEALEDHEADRYILNHWGKILLKLIQKKSLSLSWEVGLLCTIQTIYWRV